MSFVSRGLRFSPIFAVALIAACTGPVERVALPPENQVSEIRISPLVLTLEVGDANQLIVLVLDIDGQNIPAPILFASSDPAIAAVDSLGLVSALAPGTVTITVRSGLASGSIVVVVTAGEEPPPPPPAGTKSLSLTPDEAVLTGTQTLQLTATVRDPSGSPVNDPVTFTTRNALVATVSVSGLVSAQGVGSVWIVASSGTLADSSEITVVMDRVVMSGGRVFGAAVSGNVAYVTMVDDGSITRMNAATPGAGAGVRLGVELPSSIALNAAGTRAYVGSQASAAVVVVDAGSNAVITSIPIPRDVFSVAVAPGDTLLLVGTQGPMYLVDTRTASVVDSVFLSGGTANTLVIRDTLAYLNAADMGQIRVVNFHTRQLVRTLNVGGIPQGIVLSNDGTWLYLANEIGQLQIWDLRTGALAGPALALPGGGGFSIARNPVNGHIYIGTSYYGKRVIVFDPVSGNIVRQIVTGGTVRRIAFTADGLGIVANEGGWVDYIR